MSVKIFPEPHSQRVLLGIITTVKILDANVTTDKIADTNITTAKIAGFGKIKYALFVGAFFLIGGIAMTQVIAAPGWFVALDLIMAYLPMAWLGGRLAGSK